jgi:hypothetical protein
VQTRAYAPLPQIYSIDRKKHIIITAGQERFAEQFDRLYADEGFGLTIEKGRE